MAHFIDILPHLIAMSVLIACSAFFSGSEAALFFLRPRERRQLRKGTPAERAAARLLHDPDRLLSAVLFWNLVINVTYFAIASVTAMELGRGADGSQLQAVIFAFASLLAIIFFSEMLPKTLAVLSAQRISALVGIPLAITVRTVDPLMPTLRTITLLSRRLILPRFSPEPYLEVSDLERAIEISKTDASLAEQERQVLHNIVSLSDIRVDEWMRPRMQFLSFRPPVTFAELDGQLTPSGYLLTTDPDSDEVSGAIALKQMSPVGPDHLERYAEPVIYLPWCTTVANALDQMASRDREVAVVINELGETVGILTFDDLLSAIFTATHESGLRPSGREAIRSVSDGVWEVTGMISLRRLARRLDVTVPSSRSVTVSGILQDLLQRLPQPGDACRLGPLQFDVVDAPERGQLLVRVTLTEVEENGE